MTCSATWWTFCMVGRPEPTSRNWVIPALTQNRTARSKNPRFCRVIQARGDGDHLHPGWDQRVDRHQFPAFAHPVAELAGGVPAPGDHLRVRHGRRLHRVASRQFLLIAARAEFSRMSRSAARCWAALPVQESGAPTATYVS